MFRGNWDRPRYSTVVRRDGIGGGGVGGGVGGAPSAPSANGHKDQSDSENAISAAAMAMVRDDRIVRAETSKFLFQQRLKMEEHRRQLAKGNILTFLLDPSVHEKKSFMNLVLRTAGFKIADVKGVKLNDYRGNQAEVLFDPEVKIDIEDIETKLNKNKDIDNKIKIAKFNDKEDIIMVYGLPLSDDMVGLIEKIKRSIEPFVKRIIDVTATRHIGNADDDFFHNHFDGTFKVKVNPKEKMQVPNFIVVDRNVCAKVVYKRTSTPKKQMCLTCYSTDHYRTDPDCPGNKDWDQYVLEFANEWEEAARSGVDDEDEENNQDVDENNCPRISSLAAKANKLEIKEKEVEVLKTQVETLTKQSEEMGVVRGNMDSLIKELSEVKQKLAEYENFRSGEHSESSEDEMSEHSESTLNEDAMSENSESTLNSSNVVDEEDPLATSSAAAAAAADEADTENQKRPRSSPGMQREPKQGNVEIEIGKHYRFYKNNRVVRQGKIVTVSEKSVTIKDKKGKGKGITINIDNYDDYRIMEDHK